jgi:hypothetical protein
MNEEMKKNSNPTSQSDSFNAASGYLLVALHLTLKMEAVRSSQMSVNLFRTSRRHIQEVVPCVVTAVRTSNPRIIDDYVIYNWILYSEWNEWIHVIFKNKKSQANTEYIHISISKQLKEEEPIYW